MNKLLRNKISRIQFVALVFGMLGLAGFAIGFFVFHQRNFYSYLFGFLFWFDFTLGCLIVAMMHHLTGGRWGFVTRRIYEAGFMTLPLMLVFFIPIFFGVHELYPWAKPAILSAKETVAHKHIYLNQTWFVIRAIIYFAIWILMAIPLRNWSLAQDTTADVTPTRRMRTLSGPGIVIASLVITAAVIDWIMSLESDWYSTIFAVIIMGGEVLMAFALAVLLLAILRKFLPVASAATTLHFHQLGNLLLTFVMFWTYVAFGQLLIIWSGNLPHEISWYLHRIAGNWKWIISAVALFHFFLPFMLLLFRGAKRHVRALATIAAALIAIHLVYVYWLVAPSIYKHGFWISWMDLAAPIGIGGFWIAMFLQSLKRAEFLPKNDPRMEQEVAHAE
jgi:hypothetical protein